MTDSNLSPPPLAIAFCGNSILYFNDTPRLLQQMIESVTGKPIQQNSCLRGGATLTSLWNMGNGMGKKFATPSAAMMENGNDQDDGIQYDVGAKFVHEMIGEGTHWDFVVLNDYTQAPARKDTLQASLKALRERYGPLLLQANAVPVLIQTAAYRVPGIKNTNDLGNFDSMTDKLGQGMQLYVQTLMEDVGLPDVRLARVGEAYRYLHQHNHQLWKKLYSHDDFHPSPHGTWLQVCVLWCSIFSQNNTNKNYNLPVVPPVYNHSWWDQSRYMQPPDEEPLPRPTTDEAMELRNVACLICGVVDNENDARICAL